jgi:16S rRNA (adenine1518-N6/adenine1519-N6)-dimethyltransferase
MRKMPAHRTKKRFGQHFLSDPHYLNACALAIGPQPDDHLIEIGPGQGALTDYLVGKASSLALIEIDNDLIPPLQARYQDQITLHHQDVLTFDFSTPPEQPKRRIVGNFPYQISTPILFHLFQYQEHIQDIHGLLQKEVVDRLCAQPGDSTYSRLSVMAQYYCDTEALFDVPAIAFTPPPKVTSRFVRLTPRATPFSTDAAAFAELVRIAFMHRRKTLANNLKPIISAQALITLGIDPTQRPQAISLAQYLTITDSLATRD